MTIQASPSYPFEHSGPCIVAGNAWCLHNDLEQARRVYPDIPIIAVNGAAREVKAIALFSYHPERFVERGFEWIRRQRLFGQDFTVHGSRFMPDMPWVQYWHEEARGGGSSAWGARKLAKLMGFDLVVLCGCPMTAGPYVGNHGMGGTMTQESVVEKYQQEIINDTEWHKGAISLSGWTKEFLGGL